MKWLTMTKRMRPLTGLLLCLAGICAAQAEEHMSYLDNGTIRLGVNLDLGGAITYISEAKSDLNVVNSFDWGRQIQMSHYSGPVPFAPNGKQPRPDWAGLGWNPIQCGDCFGNRSKLVEHRNDGKTLYVKCIPMQWPLNNEPGECTFECWIQLEGRTARVKSRLTNARSDEKQYPARGQELPAVYTNGPWYRLMTYAGPKPFTSDELTTIPAKMPWTSSSMTENWAALVNDDGWGLGIWEPGAFSFVGGFAGKTGAGGPKDDPTGYIAPETLEIIDHNIQYEFEYVLILDRLEAIRRYVYEHAAKPAPPIYRFGKDRQHWCYVNATDTGWPIQKELKVWLGGDDPQLIGPPGCWNATEAPKLYIEAAYHAGPTRAQVFWTRHDDPKTSEQKCVTVDIVPDDNFHTYEFDLASSPEYRGIITGLRFDPVPAGRKGDYIRIKSISFTKPAG